MTIATALAVAIYEAWVVLTGKLEPAADPAGPPAGDPTGTKPVGSGA